MCVTAYVSTNMGATAAANVAIIFAPVSDSGGGVMAAGMGTAVVIVIMLIMMEVGPSDAREVDNGGGRGCSGSQSPFKLTLFLSSSILTTTMNWPYNCLQNKIS